MGAVSPDFASDARASVERAFAGEHAEFETPAHFAGGIINVVRGYAYPDRDAQGRVQGAFLLLLDISRERAFEAQLQAARDAAEEANRSKSRFLAAASHDLRQPLHAMTLFVSALRRRLPDGETGETDRQCRPVAELAALDVRYAARHVQDRGRPHQAEPRPARAQRIFRLASARLRRHGARTQHRVSRRPDFGACRLRTARCSSSRCATCSPTPSSSPAPAAFSLAAGARMARSASLVADTGVGIAPERAEQVFEEFHRDKMAAHGPNDGIGLGLAIARRLMALMGGRRDAALEARQGQRVHALAARGRRGGPSDRGAPRSARTRCRAGGS